jgi:hypothetical protein
MRDDPLIIPIRVELGSELGFLTQPEVKFAEQIERDLADLVYQLGIPGKPKVKLAVSPDARLPRLFVHGLRRRFPLSLIQEAFAYLSTSGPSAKRLTFAWPSEITKFATREEPASATEKQPPPDEKLFLSKENVAKLMAELVLAIAKGRPEILLRPEQADAYLRSTEQRHLVDRNLSRVTRILQHVLKLGHSIANTSGVLEGLTNLGADHGSDQEIAESLIPKLPSTRISIAMRNTYLKELFGIELREGQSVSVNDPGLNEQARDQFRMLADGLFYELGVRCPDIMLEASANLAEHGFVVKFNQVSGVQWLGLNANQLLANDTALNVSKLQKVGARKSGPQGTTQVQALFQRLGIAAAAQPVTDEPKETISAIEAINPVNDKDACIVSIEDKKTIEEHHLYSWDPVGYLILILTRNLRHNAWRLLDVDVIEYELAQLYEIFPELVTAIMDRVTVPQLTQILRELLREQVSIRDLRSILERILTIDYVITSPQEYIVFDDRLQLSAKPKDGWLNNATYHIQHVRAGLKSYLTYKIARGQNSVVVYLLDPQIEQEITRYIFSDDCGKDESDQWEPLLAALREEVKALPPNAIWPAILTTPEIRAFIHELVEPEFPDLFVVSYNELAPDSNIQPIARLNYEIS